MAENFLKLMADTKPQIQEAQRTPNRINTKKKNNQQQQEQPPRHTYLNCRKLRQREILNEARGKNHLQRNKDKNYGRLLFRHHSNMKREMNSLKY